MPVILKSHIATLGKPLTASTVTIKKPIIAGSTIIPPPKAKLDQDMAAHNGDTVTNRERAKLNARRTLEVDQEVAALQAQIAELTKTHTARLSELAAEKMELEGVLLQDLTDGLKPQHSLNVQLDDLVVKVSKEKEMREVFDKQLAKELLGETVFWAAVNIPLKVIDDYLPLPQRAKVLTSHFNGKRTIAVAPLIKDHL